MPRTEPFSTLGCCAAPLIFLTWIPCLFRVPTVSFYRHYRVFLRCLPCFFMVHPCVGARVSRRPISISKVRSVSISGCNSAFFRVHSHVDLAALPNIFYADFPGYLVFVVRALDVSGVRGQIEDRNRKVHEKIHFFHGIWLKNLFGHTWQIEFKIWNAL